MRVTSAAALSFLLASTDAFSIPNSFSSFQRSSHSTSFVRQLSISSEQPSENRRGLLLRSKTCLHYASTTLPDSSDPYVILNLDPGSVDLKEIKKAYRKMALLYHPDARDEADKKVANEEFARVNAAYALLTGKSEEISKVDDRNPVQNMKPKKTQWKDNSDAYRRVRINWGDDEYKKGTTSHSTVSSDKTYENWWNMQENASVPSPENVQGFDIYGNPVDRSKKPNYNPSAKACPTSSGVQGIGFHDFSTSSQVREYDSDRHPTINGNIGHTSSNKYANYGSYHHDFSMPKVPSPDNVLGFDIHGNPVVRSTRGSPKSQELNFKSGAFCDFAANAQVRDYDVNGNPIEHSKSTSSSRPSNFYSSDACMPKASTASTPNAFIQDFAATAQVRNYDVNGIPVEEGVTSQRVSSTGHPSKTTHAPNQTDNYIRDFAKYAQVRNYDMSGNPVDQMNTQPQTISGETFADSKTESRENVASKQSGKFGDEFYGNSVGTNSAFSSTASKAQYEEQPPSPDKVQRYDIYGNPIDRNTSVEYQETDKVMKNADQIKTKDGISTTNSNQELTTERPTTSMPKSIPVDEPKSSTQIHTHSRDESTVEERSDNRVRTASADYDKRMDEFEKWMQELDSDSTDTTTERHTRAASESKIFGGKTRETTLNIPHEVINEIHLEDLYQKERYSNQNYDPTNPTVRRSTRSSTKSTNAYLQQYEKYASQETHKKTPTRNARKNSAVEGDLPSFLTSVDDQDSQENPRMMSKIYDFFFPKASYVN